MTENGHGFNPREVNHRTMFRQNLQALGSPQAVHAITSLLDYVDELERNLADLTEVADDVRRG